MKRLSMMVCAAFVLSGCEQLRVESVPTGETIACDKDLTGWWRVESERADTDSEEAMHLHVADDCATWISVERKSDGSMEREALTDTMSIALRRIGKVRYLTASDRDANDGKNEIGEGHAIYRYLVRAGRIDLFEGDPRREAHRIADGLVAGRVDSSGSPSSCGGSDGCAIQTLITGNGDAIADWLKRFDPIDRPFLELRRVDEKTRSELDSHLNPTSTDGKPKPHE